jgi:hypothetical protein
MTSISDLPDFSEKDILMLQDIPNKIVVEKSITEPIKTSHIINEDNLLVGIIVLLLLYKPTNKFIDNMTSPFSNDFVNVLFKATIILIIYILIKRFILPVVSL